MSWFKRKPKPLSPFVQDVIDILYQRELWTKGDSSHSGYTDFILNGPEGIVVSRGSYHGHWYTIQIGGDYVELKDHDYKAIEPVAWATLQHCEKPEIERKRQEREAAQGRIATALYEVLG